MLRLRFDIARASKLVQNQQLTTVLTSNSGFRLFELEWVYFWCIFGMKSKGYSKVVETTTFEYERTFSIKTKVSFVSCFWTYSSNPSKTKMLRAVSLVISIGDSNVSINRESHSIII